MTTRTTAQQIKIVESAKSVKGIYFTMEYFIHSHQPDIAVLPNGYSDVTKVGFEAHRKGTIELEAYRKQALDWLNAQLAAQPAPEPKPAPAAKVSAKAKSK